MREWAVQGLLIVIVIAFFWFLFTRPAAADPPLYKAPGPVPVQPVTPRRVGAPTAPVLVQPSAPTPGAPPAPILKVDPAMDYLSEVGLGEAEQLGIDPELEYGIGDE